MRILSEAYNDPAKAEFYNFLRALDALKASLKKNGNILMLDKDSELVKILYDTDEALGVQYEDLLKEQAQTTEATTEQSTETTTEAATEATTEQGSSEESGSDTTESATTEE